MSAGQPMYSNVPAPRRYSCGVEGTGAAHPTKLYGDKITVTRTAAGVFLFTFASHPGYFRGFSWSVGADTPSAVKGYTVSRDTFTPATSSVSASIELSLWDSTFTAVELADNQYLDVEFVFSEVSI